MPKLKKFRPTCIRQWRHYRGLTLETVAERIDMTPGLVSLVERGLRGYTQDTVEALASAMRTDPAGLLTRDPTDPNATRLIAQAALQQHGAPRAIDYLKSFVDKSPPDAATLNLLGTAYMADGKPDAALQQFEKAATLDPENATIKTRIAVAEINSGRARQGVTQLEEVFSGEAGAPVAGPALVLAELRAGHVDKAAEVAKLLIKRDHGNLLYQTNSAGGGPRCATRLCRRGSRVSRRPVAQSGFYGGHSRLGPALCDHWAHRRCQANLPRCSYEEPAGYDGPCRSRRPRHCGEEIAGSYRPAQQRPRSR